MNNKDNLQQLLDTRQILRRRLQRAVQTGNHHGRITVVNQMSDLEYRIFRCQNPNAEPNNEPEANYANP